MKRNVTKDVARFSPTLFKTTNHEVKLHER